ncbi:NTP transferase domain-containing protein [Sphingomonas sp. BIUV-7]|uniref:NTP transferase domain-containing protein n=1 Tax=Sphingomonas natans TaxID=3063330 RepID=A0ABT8YD56_9SPHN|nr:NTP transferase domain-containing protein [Sphingomonas sp. BIUV-7]MDO6416267.1 NTP transferase domain-containing protein [Sphingomonas sp. BIUV-7]
MMDYVFLSAGAGSRMGALTQNQPKALVEILGRPIAEHTIEAIAAALPGSAVLLVSGYRADALEGFARKWQNSETTVSTIFNPDFAAAGPLRSIEIALSALPREIESLTIGNGDTIFEATAISALAAAQAPAAMLVSSSSEADPDDVQVEIARSGIVRAQKRLGSLTAFELSAGLLQLRGRDVIQLCRMCVMEALEDERTSGIKQTWHSIIARLAAGGAAPQPVFVPCSTWCEFDDELSIARYTAAHHIS